MKLSTQGLTPNDLSTLVADELDSDNSSDFDQKE